MERIAGFEKINKDGLVIGNFVGSYQTQEQSVYLHENKNKPTHSPHTTDCPRLSIALTTNCPRPSIVLNH